MGLKEFLKTITLEPAAIPYAMGFGILNGAAIQTDLVIWKICHIQLNQTQEICDNLSADENSDIEFEVQRRLQDFEMITQWIKSAPTFVYAFFIGALSDRFGRKPIILLPMLGYLIDLCLNFINYAFIEKLPLEFMYSIVFSGYLGGFPMYYLGKKWLFVN